MKHLTVFLSVLLIMACVFACGCSITVGGSTETQYLRIHIRANSNNEEDQAVKYKVKDAVVELLTPLVADCVTVDDAKTVIGKNLERIEDRAEEILRVNGFNYGAKAKVNNEQFPTRIYDGVTLQAGFYDALIIGLGDAAGDNWWCVVYPPLCFTGSEVKVEYKSKIYEIIRQYFN